MARASEEGGCSSTAAACAPPHACHVPCSATTGQKPSAAITNPRAAVQFHPPARVQLAGIDGLLHSRIQLLWCGVRRQAQLRAGNGGCRDGRMAGRMVAATGLWQASQLGPPYKAAKPPPWQSNACPPWLRTRASLPRCGAHSRGRPVWEGRCRHAWRGASASCKQFQPQQLCATIHFGCTVTAGPDCGRGTGATQAPHCAASAGNTGASCHLAPRHPQLCDSLA